MRERKKYDVYPTNNTNRDLVVARGEVKESFIGQRTFLAVGIEQFFIKGRIVRGSGAVGAGHGQVKAQQQ